MVNVTIDAQSPDADAAIAAARALVTARFATSAEGDDTATPTPSAHAIWNAQTAEVVRDVLGDGDPEAVARRLAYLLWAMADASYDLTTTSIALCIARHGDPEEQPPGAAAEAIMECVRLAFAPNPPA